MKIKRWTVWFAAACLVSAAAPAASQDVGDDDAPFDRDCMDDYGRNLCEPEKWSEIVASFDLEPAEVVQGQGWRGVRVFTVDGYSRDMPMVSVLHSRRSEYGYALDPQLEVRATRDVTEPAPVLRRTAWTGLAWDADAIGELAAAAPVRQSDEEDGRPATTDGGEEEIVMCLHAWVTVTEVLSDEGVIRRVRNACGEDDLFDAGYGLSAKALRGFPHCNHLDPENYRNESQQLNRCLTLQGDDLIASAEVLNIVDGEVFDEASTIVQFATAETRVRGVPTGTSLTAALDLEEARVVRLYAGSIRSAGPEVMVDGQVHRYGQGDDDDRAADVRHVWRKRGGVWRLVEFTRGPWRPI